MHGRLSKSAWIPGLLVALFLTQGLWAQVSVSVRLNKTQFLRGEPIVVVLDVKNIGAAPVKYGSGCDSEISLSLPDIEERLDLRSHGCFKGTGSIFAACFGVSHGPVLEPGESITFQKLLTGYRLEVGSYTLKAAGNAPLDSAFDDGNHFDTELPFQVRMGSDAELNEVFASWIDQARPRTPDSLRFFVGHGLDPQQLAREAIEEAAPAFLEDTVKDMLDAGPDFVVRTLRNINTDASRNDLVELYRRAGDKLRPTIMAALSDIPNVAQFDFFVEGLRSADPGTLQSAIMAIGRIGGGPAVEALASVKTRDPEMSESLNDALSMTKSGDAVSVLIGRARRRETRPGVCNALKTLTHRDWCATSMRTWKLWWERHQASVSIYGDDECNGAFSPQPLE